jgi:hypothetical protein
MEGKFVEAEKVLTDLLNGKLLAELQPVTRLLLCECYINNRKLTNYD